MPVYKVYLQKKPIYSKVLEINANSQEKAQSEAFSIAQTMDENEWEGDWWDEDDYITIEGIEEVAEVTQPDTDI